MKIRWLLIVILFLWAVPTQAAIYPAKFIHSVYKKGAVSHRGDAITDCCAATDDPSLIGKWFYMPTTKLKKSTGWTKCQFVDKTPKSKAKYLKKHHRLPPGTKIIEVYFRQDQRQAVRNFKRLAENKGQTFCVNIS